MNHKKIMKFCRWIPNKDQRTVYNVQTDEEFKNESIAKITVEEKGKDVDILEIIIKPSLEKYNIQECYIVYRVKK